MNRIVVSTDCICDLPAKLIEKYSIPVMYYYITIDKFRFRDIKEIDSNSVLEYLEDNKKRSLFQNKLLLFQKRGQKKRSLFFNKLPLFYDLRIGSIFLFDL